jgi:putative ubiquitin-RnfH superfamily antitoxin RatB of RatAB toxin-antitoxin module
VKALSPEATPPTAATAPAGTLAGESVQVEVVYAPPGGPVDLTRLVLPAGATLAQAVAESGVLLRHGLGAEHGWAGIWGRRAQPESTLRNGDRVELYRPLLCDPKEARRQRHSATAVGLEPGADPAAGREARRSASRSRPR